MGLERRLCTLILPDAAVFSGIAVGLWKPLARLQRHTQPPIRVLEFRIAKQFDFVFFLRIRLEVS